MSVCPNAAGAASGGCGAPSVPFRPLIEAAAALSRRSQCAFSDPPRPRGRAQATAASFARFRLTMSDTRPSGAWMRHMRGRGFGAGAGPCPGTDLWLCRTGGGWTGRSSLYS